jgi:hypothetical protein
VDKIRGPVPVVLHEIFTYVNFAGGHWSCYKSVTKLLTRCYGVTIHSGGEQ